MKTNKKLTCALNVVFFVLIAVFAVLYILYDEGDGAIYAFKYVTSALVLIEAGIGLLIAKLSGGKMNIFSALLALSFILCLCGDVVIIYSFIAGMILFAIAHIGLIAGFTRVNILGWKHIIPFIVFALFSLLMIFLFPSFDFGSYLPYVIVYAIVISAMVGMGLGNALDGTVNIKVRVVLGAGVLLFYASDLCLTLWKFAGGGKVLDVLCLVFYYLALFLLARLPQIYTENACAPQKAKMNVLKRLWCRAFQFVFHIAIPFLPYKNPVTLHSCDEAAEMLSQKGKKKPLIVTDKGILSSNLVKPLWDALDKKGIQSEIYSDTVVNPTIQNAEEAAKLYLDKGCDCIIAIGGGSAMDCAKGAGLRILKPKRTFKSMRGILKVFGKLPLFIAVPTTSGTGSETTIAAVFVY